MNAMVVLNMYLGKKTRLYFADEEIFFDGLWIQDCLIEMWRVGNER